MRKRLRAGIPVNILYAMHKKKTSIKHIQPDLERATGINVNNQTHKAIQPLALMSTTNTQGNTATGINVNNKHIR